MKIYPTQKKVLTVGVICVSLVLLFPPWFWSQSHSSLLSADLIEVPMGIAYGIGWQPPHVVLGPEDEVMFPMESGTRPQVLCLCTPLLAAEILLVVLLTFWAFCKAWEYERNLEADRSTLSPQ